MKPKEPITKRVLQLIQEHQLTKAQQPLVVGVSGGPDSVCLLHILVDLQETLEITLHAAHLNHGLRGAESDADARYVSHLAYKLGVPVTVTSLNVQAYRAQHHCSLEEAARELRYGFFSEVVTSVGASRVAVGHTADDQVETILMHLVRGAGLSGLAGMQPITTWHSSTTSTQLTVVRPLLGITRKEVEAYCAAHKLSPRTDTSNWSPAYLRNRFRSELIPLLRSYNPNISAALLRTARTAADQISFLDSQVSQLWNRIVEEHPGRIILDTRAVVDLPGAIKRHLFRRILQQLLGDLMEIEFTHIESIMSALTKPAGKKLSLPGGLVFSVDYETCTLGFDAVQPCPLPPLEGEHRLILPGETTLPGWRVRGSILEQPPAEKKSPGLTAYLDLDIAGTELVVRPRRPGDRFQPLGMASPKKIQDFMVDAKIPRSWRKRVPLVCSPHHILWVVSWRIDERAKVSNSTQRVLRLEFEKV